MDKKKISLRVSIKSNENIYQGTVFIPAWELSAAGALNRHIGSLVRSLSRALESRDGREDAL